jgi:hypothetical protein
MSRRPLVSAAALAVLSASLPACGKAELEAQLQSARLEKEALAADLNAKLSAAEGEVRTAKSERRAAHAELGAQKAQIDAQKTQLEKSKKDLELVTAHRDELTEWIEKELLPAAEEHQPELVNLRTATEEMQKAVAEIRGLEWKSPVMRRRIGRDQVGEWMMRDLRKEIPPEKAFEMVAVGAEMGLVKPGTDLYAMFSEFMTAGAAAFYKPDTRTFYHIEGNDGRGAYPVVFHELVHAIEDQHFDLDAFYRAVEDDTDRALARRAVVEGSASWFQDRYQTKNPGDVREMMRAQMKPEMLQRQQKMLQTVPAFLVATIGLYPYNNAKTWVGKMAGGDASKVALLFQDPPESTEQVLHPEKFSDPTRRDYPRKVSPPDLAALPASWKRLDPDSMGELTTGCLLAQLRFPGMGAFLAVLDPSTGGVLFKDPVKSAVAGWDGDRYACAIDPKTERATIVWTSVWDSEQDAGEFATAYATLVGKKLTGAADTDLPSPVRFTEGGTERVSAVETKGTTVVAVLGAPREFLDQLLAAGFAAKVETDPRDAADAAGQPAKDAAPADAEASTEPAKPGDPDRDVDAAK